MDLWLLVLLGLGGFALLTGVAVFVLAKGQFRQARQIQIAYERSSQGAAVLCEPSARFLGLASGADAPLGEGVLLLAEDELYFERFHPQSAWRLPLHRVLKIERPGTFLEASRPDRRFFVLVYHDDDGKAERAGFRVVDVDRWILDSGNLVRKLRGFGMGGCS